MEMGVTRREVENVKHDEAQQEQSAKEHRSRGSIRGTVSRLLRANRLRSAVAIGKLNGTHDVQHETK
jgi:hypothetical protein